MRRLALPLLVVGLLLAADQGIKAWVVATLPLGAPQPVIPGLLYLTHQQNIGVGFSLLRGTPVWALAGITVGVLTLFFFLASPYLSGRWGVTAAMLITAGACGNLIDRLTRHSVVDYIDVHAGWFWYPVFNLADSLIVVGVGVLVFAVIREPRRQAPTTPAI
jgi:signal peptidase II